MTNIIIKLVLRGLLFVLAIYLSGCLEYRVVEGNLEEDILVVSTMKTQPTKFYEGNDFVSPTELSTKTTPTSVGLEINIPISTATAEIKITTETAVILDTKEPTNTSVPRSFDNPKPVYLRTIKIRGDSEEGIKFTALEDGHYIFTYAGGAYSPYPGTRSYQKLWRTKINVYKNRPIVWDIRPYTSEDDRSKVYLEPSKPDSSIGSYEMSSFEEAVIIAHTSDSMRFNLEAGDSLIFVGSDDQNHFNGTNPNVGDVYVNVTGIIPENTDYSVNQLSELYRPVSFGTINVPGDSEEGYKFTAIQDGFYIFTYVRGAYSPYPGVSPNQKLWRTKINVYKNRPILWDKRPYTDEDDISKVYLEPSNPDGSIGDYEMNAYYDAIFIASSSAIIRLDLEAGDTLIFVTIDDQNQYNHAYPNVGEVYINATAIVYGD